MTTYVPTPKPFHPNPNAAPAFMADVHSKHVFNDRSRGWAERTRAHWLAQYGVMPTLLDFERERARRRVARGDDVAATTEGGAAFVLPMLSDTPSPMWLNRLNRRDRERERRERRAEERREKR